MIKRLVLSFWAIFLLITFVPNIYVIAVEPWEAALAEANTELNPIYGQTNKESDAIYKKINVNGEPINTLLANPSSGLKFTEDGETYGPKALFVYGSYSASEQWLVDNGLSAAGSEQPADWDGVTPRTLGFTMNGVPFPNPNYIFGYDPDTYDEVKWFTLAEILNGLNDTNVNAWLGSPLSGRKNAMYTKNFPNDAFLDLHPDLEDRSDIKLSDYAYILQLPSKDSWGMAIFFHKVRRHSTGNTTTLYSTALIKPYSLQKSDISVGLIYDASSVSSGNNIPLEFLVESIFTYEINTNYTLKIDSVVKASGLLRIPASASIIYPYEFTMPNHDVLIEFIVNETGDNPDEENLDNNRVEIPINVANNIPIEGEFDLDYNILERNIKFNLGETQARLRLPRGSWDGNATGALNVTNDTTPIYRNFSVDGSTGSNPYVLSINEASATITRNPLVHALLRRQDFEDNPVTRIYGVTKTKTGQASAGGSVRRPYFYYCGGEFCSGHRSTTRADFNRIVNKNEITANVYNGKSVIAPPVFRNEITNVSPSFAKTMWWTSHPYTLDVVRLMYNQNEDGSLTPGQYPSRNNSDGIKVDGRFKRVFTEQNKSDIAWSIVPNHSMVQEYKNDREKAKNRNYNLNSSEKVAFASDVTYNGINYPIRSGYYFNPSGTYTFTLTSEIYKDLPDSTPEHEKLVNDFISSFRYESNMTYIDPAKNAVRIDGSSATKIGTTYPAQAAFVSVGGSPLFDINVADHEETVNGHLFDMAVKMQYTKVGDEELRHNYVSIGANAITDGRFKAILEGYSESDTLDSLTDYKYVEFVKGGQHIHKITETTTVTFRINPSNRKVYTHAQMKGNAKTPEDYKIRVYIADVDVKDVTEYGAPVQAGVASPRGLTTVGGTLPSMPLDQINISVVGSMYDDAR